MTTQNSASSTIRPFNIQALTRRFARSQPTPHIVDCDGLTRSNLTGPDEFEHELQQRRDWCEANAGGGYEIEPIGTNPEALTGRRFRFANANDAVFFKLNFPIDLWP